MQNVNTSPILVKPPGCAVHAKWGTAQPRDIHKRVFCLCAPSRALENWGVLECYTGIFSCRKLGRLPFALKKFTESTFIAARIPGAHRLKRPPCSEHITQHYDQAHRNF